MNDELPTLKNGPESPGRQPERRSFLVADLGSGNVKVALFDRVDGLYRLIAAGKAQSTAGAPYFDARRGLQQALSQIVQATGRLLIDRRGHVVRPTQLDGSGVDFFGLLVSSAEPLKVITVGLLDSVSVTSLRRAIETVYARELDCFSLSDRRPQRLQLESMLGQRPDLLLLGGGTDGGADRRLIELIDWLSLSVELQNRAERPALVYAGNRELRPYVQRQFEDIVDLYFSANVRPAFHREDLDEAIALLNRIYLDMKVARIPGASEILDWTSAGAQPAAHAFGALCEYMAAQVEGRVLGIDLGSHAVAMANADLDAAHLDIDTRVGAGRPVEEPGIGPADLGKWFYNEPGLKDVEVVNQLHDRALHPNLVAMTQNDLAYERAVVRQLLRRALEGVSHELAARPVRRMLLRGQILTLPRQAGRLLLAVLEALQPRGTFSVWVDRLEVLPALGLLSVHAPEVVVQVLDAGPLTELATVIVPTSAARQGDEILKVTVSLEGRSPQQLSITQGSLVRLALPEGKRSVVRLSPDAGCDIGYGPGQGRELEVNGGPLGLVIDARGRPLTALSDPEAFRQLRESWQREMAV
jgi:hypothetical protein